MDALLETIPPIAVYLIVGLVIGLESLGIPLPGEIALVSAALLASRHTLDINPVAVGAAWQTLKPHCGCMRPPMTP